MARVLPFVGTRYNPKSVDDLSQVMAPPYDVISPQMQETLYQKSPFNVVRVDLGKEQVGDDEYNNKYQRAASYLRDWKSKGILIDDPQKNFYLYQQEFSISGGKTHIRNGFFAAILLEDPEKGMIRGHERTFEGPKADRLKLLRSTGCNLSPVFCLYSDPEHSTDQVFDSITSADPPRVVVTDEDGVTHRLWLINSLNRMKHLSALMQPKRFFIADGHHRYETAMQYCKEMARAREIKKGDHPPFTYTFAYLTSADSEGMVILPTHRVLAGELGEGVDHAEIMEDLKRYFHVTPLQINLKKAGDEGDKICARIAQMGAQSPAFAMVLPGGKGCILSLKADAAIQEDMDESIPEPIARLDVTILHEYVIPKVWIGNPEISLDDRDISYVRGAGEALEKLEHPVSASVVFLMNAPQVAQVQDIASQNLRMPHKTTYFYPKLLTGMVLRDLSAPW